MRLGGSQGGKHAAAGSSLFSRRFAKGARFTVDYSRSNSASGARLPDGVTGVVTAFADKGSYYVRFDGEEEEHTMREKCMRALA